MIRTKLESYITALWYSVKNTTGQKVLLVLLSIFVPLSALVIKQRYRKRQLLPPEADNPPVVIIGNLSAGGTGKTPVIAYMVRRLQSRGLRVGVVARGYRAEAGSATEPVSLSARSLVSHVGDEPLMLWQAFNLPASGDAANDSGEVPVVVCAMREKAVNYLRSRFDIDIVLSDDGLQHYALKRNYEIVVVDGARQFGNGQILPKGPLREPLERLESVHRVLVNGVQDLGLDATLKSFAQQATYFQVEAVQIVPLNSKALEIQTRVEDALEAKIESVRKLRLFSGLQTCRRWCLVAGIGNPDRFFSQFSDLCTESRISVTHWRSQAFSNHHQYKLEDFEMLKLADDESLLMTEKDAIKCVEFIEDISAPAYALRIEACFEQDEWLDTMLTELKLN